MSEPASPESTTPTPPPPSPPASDSNRTLMLVLSYLGILGLIPLLMEKEDREVQWHAKHGLVLFGALIALQILVMFVGSVAPTVGCILSLGLTILWLGYVVVVILCITKALKGERFRVPGLSDFADKWR